MKEGSGAFTYQDGSIFFGFFKNDKKNGIGTMTPLEGEP